MLLHLVLVVAVGGETFRVRRSEEAETVLSDQIDIEEGSEDLLGSETKVVTIAPEKYPLHQEPTVRTLPTPPPAYPSTISLSFHSSTTPPYRVTPTQNYQEVGSFRPPYPPYISPGYPFYPQHLAGNRYLTTPPPNPYAPLLQTPAITFLDESPSPHSIHVTPRSFTPKPKPKEEKTEVAPLIASLVPENNSPAHLALLTVGLQADPSLQTNQAVLPREHQQSTDLNTSEYDATVDEENLVDNLSAKDGIANNQGNSSYEVIDKELLTKSEENFLKDEIEIFEERRKPETNTFQDEKMDSVSSSYDLTNNSTVALLEAEVIELANNLKKTFDNSDNEKDDLTRTEVDNDQLAVSKHPEETLQSQPEHISENEIKDIVDDFDIFSDESLPLTSHQDVPRSPTSLPIEVTPALLQDNPTIPLQVFGENQQKQDSILNQKPPELDDSSPKRPIRIKLQNFQKKKGIKLASIQLVEKHLREQELSKSSQTISGELSTPSRSPEVSVLRPEEPQINQALLLINNEQNDSEEDSNLSVTTKIPNIYQNVEELLQNSQLDTTDESSPLNPQLEKKGLSGPVLTIHDSFNTFVPTLPPRSNTVKTIAEDSFSGSGQSPPHPLRFVPPFSGTSDHSLENIPVTDSRDQRVGKLFQPVHGLHSPVRIVNNVNQINSLNNSPSLQPPTPLEAVSNSRPQPNQGVPVISDSFNTFTPTINSAAPSVKFLNNNPLFPQGVFLRDPSDYIFQPKVQLPSAPFNIETGEILPRDHSNQGPPAQRQSGQFVPANEGILFHSPFISNKVPPVPFEDVSQRPRQQKSFESAPIFNENRPIDLPQKHFSPLPPIQNPPPTPPSHLTLFQSINQEAIDRPIRKKQEVATHKTESKSAALAALVSIAGSDWDTNLHTTHTVLDTSTTDFSCPAISGHFPDTENCSVYYQCAGGVAHKHTCQQGLLWNMVINMCDWETNVDCEINKGNRGVPTQQQGQQAGVSDSISQPFIFTAFVL